MNQPKIERRDVDGVVLLDKPQGMTSNQALQVVKRLFRARKAGHTGSLDPLATGLLPICLGEATKVSAYLLDADKHYRTTGELGTTTRTGDAEGEVLERRPVEGVDAAAVEAVLAGFRGEIEQVPPMYSALKQDGRRLYELARKGVEVERAPRRVTIRYLELLRLDGRQMELDVRCSKGTYIRTLVEDIGAGLGCGAHVAALRRVGVSPYDEPRMWTLDALRALAEAGDAALDEALTPLDAALVHWPAVRLDADSAWYLCQGQAVWVPGAPTSGHLRLYGADGAFLGVGHVLDDGRVAPKRLLRAAA